MLLLAILMELEEATITLKVLRTWFWEIKTL